MGKENKLKKILRNQSIHNLETSKILRKISHRQDEDFENRLDHKLQELEYNSLTKTQKVKKYAKNQLKDLRFWLLLIVIMFNLWKFEKIDFDSIELLLHTLMIHSMGS